ncbi:MAG: hypothetical protein ACHQIK_16800 [Candidatus Acidiferrales bacterium]
MRFDFRPSSLGWLLSLVDYKVIEGVAVGVVAVDFEHFRDVAASWSALDLNRDMSESAMLLLIAR